MKSLATLIALAFVLVLSQSAEAQFRFRNRQPDVQVNINNGVAPQNFRQQQNVHQGQRQLSQREIDAIRYQQFLAQQRALKQQALRQQQYYVPQPQAIVTYAVPVQQQGVCHGCNGGGLQFNAGCSTFFQP